jgi:hypothetical protein
MCTSEHAGAKPSTIAIQPLGIDTRTPAASLRQAGSYRPAQCGSGGPPCVESLFAMIA